MKEKKKQTKKKEKKKVRKTGIALLFLQMDDIFTPMSWYPPITPPTSSKKDVFAIEEFILVDEKAKQVCLIKMLC